MGLLQYRPYSGLDSSGYLIFHTVEKSKHFGLWLYATTSKGKHRWILTRWSIRWLRSPIASPRIRFALCRPSGYTGLTGKYGNDPADTVGEICEKIILFGSNAYGTPNKDSDYDFFVVLQKIYRSLAKRPMGTPVDVLANYKSRFEWRSTQPTIERRIASDGVVLYERH